MSTQFSTEELKRYQRQLVLPGFGEEAQQKLKASKILLVGAGGLGSPTLLYLAAAGVGTIGIVDFDRIDETNLQRQVLFTTEEIGRLKAEVAEERARALNPHININAHHAKLDASNALDIIRNYDLVSDGTDNFPTRYLVNDACVLLNKPFVYGSIFKFEGQVAVFNLRQADGTRGPNYRDLYPRPPAPGTIPDCAEGGVLGALPGIIGSMQALEAIKIITGTGEPLSGRLFTFDALRSESMVFAINKREDNPLTGRHPTINKLIDYENFCAGDLREDTTVKQISAEELKSLLASGEPYQIIDVREPYEYAEINIGGDLIPLSEITNYAIEISRNHKVIVHCKTGSRSKKAIIELEKKFGFTNLYNLQGGIDGFGET